MSTMTKEIETGAFAPLGAQSGEPLRLAMQELFLTGRVLPVGARLLVRHTFRSAEAKTIEAVYCFPLPRDAALRRFEIQGENKLARVPRTLSIAPGGSYSRRKREEVTSRSRGLS